MNDMHALAQSVIQWGALTLLFVFGIGILAVIAIYLIDKNQKPKPKFKKSIKTVFVEDVKNTEVPILLSASGNLVAKNKIDLFSEVQGVFKAGSKLFRPGQKFRSGETLIGIDASEYYASVQSAKSNLYNSIAAIMPDLRLDFPEVYPKWQNYLNGFDLNNTTPKLPEMTSEKENYFITGRGIVSTYYNVNNLEQRLLKFNIRAPFSGILTEALVTEGSLIRNGQKLGEYIDPTVYEMEVALSKSFASLLKVGEEVKLNNLKNTEQFVGKVSRVNGSIDATTQTITAYIEVKNESLKEGIYLEANLNAKSESNAVEVNRSLVFDSNQMFIVRDGVLDVIEVNPVYFSDTKAVIKDIPNGTIILSRPVPGAYAGMAVKPFVAESGKTSTK